MGVTIHDLAVLAGVNASTVSRALRGDSRVRLSTRETIAELARRHNYVPNRAARSLASGSTGTIWLLLTDLSSELERRAASIIGSVIEDKSNYDLLIAVSGNSPGRFAKQVGKLTQHLTDAAIIFAPTRQVPESVRHRIDSLAIPALYLDRGLGGKPPLISSDNASAARELATLLAGDGGKTAFLLDMSVINAVSALRFKTARQVLTSLGAPCFTSSASLCRFLSKNRDCGIGVISENYRSEAIRELADAAATRRCAGGFFDEFNAELSPLRYDKAAVCRQDFSGLSELAAEAILSMLAGKPVAQQQLRSCRIEVMP